MITGTSASQATGAVSPIVFTSCSLLEAAQESARLAASAGEASTATKPATKRREVSVGGKRVKTIDVHAHCVIPETLALTGHSRNPQRGPGIEEVGERRIREMDE